MTHALARAARQLAQLSRTQALALLTLAFVASRLACWSAGVRFDAGPVNTYFQYLDPRLLREDLARSLLYLHSQPPLFNLFLGGLLKICPNQLAAAGAVVFLAFGVALYLGAFLLMERLAVPRLLNTALVLWLMLNPAALLYENWLFYDYPLAGLLALAALLLHGFVARPGLARGCCFFAALAGLALTRSLFHPAWLVLWAALLIYALRSSRRAVCVAAAIPLALVCAWYGKNAVLFGAFTGSTWAGMNLARISTFQEAEIEREVLAADGFLSKLALVPPFGSLRAYADQRPPARPPIHPALDDETKSTGAVNFNHRDYIEISRGYLADARRVIFHRPWAYLDGVLRAWFCFFIPGSDYPLLRENRSRIRVYDCWFNRLLAGQVCYRQDSAGGELTSGNLAWGLIAAYFVALGGAALALRRMLRARVPEQLPELTTVLFLWTTVLYVAVVGNCFEVGENNRFRFLTDPLVLCLLGWLAGRWRRVAPASCRL
jgi:hypothetical protein